ncbi:MAG TPA: MFS transporter [Burkholderiales bacterium]|nr:MFS transporter [Burkholderiales bacterium]
MTESSQFRLIAERRFGPFFATQLLGAFNDNLYKNALVILVTYQAAAWTSMNPALLANGAAGLFILPYVILSAFAGQLADKLDKSLLIKAIKAAEVLIMALAGVGFAMHSLTLLLVVLFLMGTHSTFFGPVKYAILPQMLREDELIGGNGLVETGTFLAILIGTLLAGLLAVSASVSRLVLAVVATACAGLAASLFIPKAAAASPQLRLDWNPLRSTAANLRAAAANRTVFLSIMGISWFWFYGALVLTQLPAYSKSVLGGNEEVVTLLLAVFSTGVGAGSLLCERLSGHKVEIGLVPFGSIGLTVFAVDLFFATPMIASSNAVSPLRLVHAPGALRVLADLALIGLFGGFYIVPLYALVQQRSPAAERSRIISANNIFNAAFMVVAALFAAVALRNGATIPELILATGIMNAVVAMYIYTLVPEFLLRFLCWMLVHSVYRLNKEGIERIPETGPALLVCNHVSYVDALIISAACRRPIRFVMHHWIYRNPVLGWIFRGMKAIPVASAKDDPEILARAMDEVAATLNEGELVCIFPEGRLTLDGEIGEFRSGVNRILARTPVRIVPLALSGLWGSLFSTRAGAWWRRWRRGLFSHVDLRIGEPLAPDAATPQELRATVLALRGAKP